MKRVISKLFVGVLSIAGFGGQALAQDFFEGPALSFTNLELGYEQRYFDFDGADDGHGVHAGFSIAPIPFLYFAGDFRYATAETFFNEDDVEFLDTRVGIGGRIRVADTVAFYVEGGAAYGRLDLPNDEGYDGAGFYIEPGLKVGLFGRVEGSVALEYTNLESETFLGAKAGLMIGITDRVGITVDAGISEHSDFIGLGLRIAW